MSDLVIAVARVRVDARRFPVDRLEDAIADCLHHHLHLTVERVSVQKPASVAVTQGTLPLVSVFRPNGK